MLEKRETYLAQISALGRGRRALATHSSTLCNVVNYLLASDSGRVTEKDISDAAHRWREDVGVPGRREEFETVARSWCRFLGVYSPHERDEHPYKDCLLDFRHALQDDRGYLQSTIRAWIAPTRQLLHWISSRQKPLSTIVLTDIDDFIAEIRSRGAKNATVACYCQALRAFFRFAEQRGLNHSLLSKTISAPMPRKQKSVLLCPSWADVRRMLASLDDSRPFGCRAKVVILLASIYGLRCSEISHLTLDDIDWYHEVLTVRRAKHGKLQQFPLQFEVGQAIIHYLKNFRPSSRVRNLILTHHTPYRPVFSLASAMANILSAPKMMGRPCGIHSLRHACATELLRRGTSLKGIADLLGHSGLRSVSIYAHCNVVALQRVADFSLKEIL
jgi:site-specific recombinase XerD